MTIWGITLLVIFFGTIYFWNARQQHRESTVIKTSYHPALGEIRHYPSCWKADLTAPAWGHPVLVWGDDPETVLTEPSLKSLHHIKENYLTLLLPECINAISDLVGKMDIRVTKENVRLESIDLYSNDAGHFNLNYVLPSFQNKVPHGVSVCFEDFKLVDVSDNH